MLLSNNKYFIEYNKQFIKCGINIRYIDSSK